MKDITVETLRYRRRFTVGVWPFDTIRQMKEAIERCQDFPVASQSLFFDGKLLDDKHLAETYAGLLDDGAPPVKLRVAPVPGLRLRVTLVSAVPDVQFSLRYDAHEPLATLKKRIHEIEHVPVDRLAFSSVPGDADDADSKSFADFGVTDHLRMGLLVKSMTVRVVGTSTEHFLSQDVSESVGAFREKLRKSLRVPADRRVLLFVDGGDRELREEYHGGAALADQGVAYDSVVDLVVAAANKPPAGGGGGERMLGIKIRRSKSPAIFYFGEQAASEPVIRLKERVKKSYCDVDIPASWVALFLCDWELRDDWPLGYYYGLDDCPVLKWKVKPVPGAAVRLTVKTASAAGAGDEPPVLLSLEQDLIETVGRLRERIGAALRVPAERIKMSSAGGQELRDDGEALGYCGLVDRPVLSVAVRVRLTVQAADAGCAFDLLGDPTESVGRLKERIREALGVLADDDDDQQTSTAATSLFVGECELEDDVRTLESYGVADGSVVKVQFMRGAGC